MLSVITILVFCFIKPAYSLNQPPQFVNTSLAFFVNESSPVGHKIDIAAAVDPDDDVLYFSIIGDVANSILRLEYVEGDMTKVWVILKKEVDRETIDEYEFAMRVEDDDQNFHDKYANLYVLDANDNAPLFQNLPYRADIKEDAPLGSFVYTVYATDADSGAFAIVNYAITTPQYLYAIQRNQGNVTLNGTLDYEQVKFYQLEIMAYDLYGLNTTTDLVINVLDVQDTAPFFVNLPYVESIYENIQPGSSVLQAEAMDGDRGIPNPVNYTFSSGNYKWFEIDANSGLITVGPDGIDREDPEILALFGVLEFVVMTQEVTDTPQGPTIAYAPVTIRVLDVNDQTPSFELDAYTGEVQENTQNTIPVSMSTDVFVFDYDNGDNGTFEIILEQNGAAFDVFDVIPNPILNEANLLFRVKDSTALDYEVVTSYTFDAIAREKFTPELLESRASITINLLDVNDNWPEFEEDSYEARIDENSPNNTLVTTITATDRDSGIFGTVRYELRGASANLFRVDANGNMYVNVNADVDTSLLDREKQDSHYLNYEAVDGGNLRTSVPLVVILNDVNDNAPEILRDEYEGYVQENEPSLERELFVEATDDDLPPNNEIEFSITSGDPLNNFTINPVTGEIGLSAGQSLDYEALPAGSGGIYTLTVMAKDGGAPPLNSTCTVIINVEDQNDEEPYFDMMLYNATIPENSQGGTNVTQVHANDDDGTSPNNEVIYRIESGGLDKFRIDSNTGLISVQIGANLDRDVFETQYNLRILAIDKGTPPLTGTTTVRVDISDVNNKHPVFDPPQDSTRILENTTVGTNFFTYTATDLDLNAILRYKLLDDLVYGEDENKEVITDMAYLASLFGIHADTGTVFVKSDLDRETAEVIRITVFVEDIMAEEPPIQNATATLMITLVDVNDNPPEFQPSDQYTALVPESSSVGFEVKKVEAIDRDKNPGPVRYYMVYEPNNPQSEAFEITEENRELGMVTLAQEVDYEEYQRIDIKVEAIDSGTPALSSTATIIVTIEDVNDNSPEWQVFEEVVEVWENATISTNVTHVFATDRDSGEYGRVMYFIISGDQGDFALDNTTGVLTTFDNIDRETIASYSLTIEARDNNNAPPSQQRKTPGYMQINLIDVNDNNPMFDQPFYYRETQENVEADTEILTVQATDKDEGVNALITYTLDPLQGNGSHLFKIHPITGQISTAIELTGNFGDFYIVAIATDGGNPPLSNTTLVQIWVEDVNDHDPEIVQPDSNATIYLYEHEPVGYFVVQVIAEDADAGINGMVNYEFVTSASSRPDYMYFNIGRESGNITVAKDIDREIQEIYYLAVRAYDLGTPPRDDLSTIVVRALDIDDHPPSFDREMYPPPYPVSVLEEHSNVFVANLSLATDPDVGNNSIICYYIVGGDEPYEEQFYMNKTTGELWLGPSIDREIIDKVHLIIEASEDCWSDFYEREENLNREWNYTDTSTLLVRVDILDINDNPPHFLRKWFTDGVTKDTQFGEEVVDVSEYTVDPDIGNNSLLSYVIDGPFRFSNQLKGEFEDDPFTIGLRDGIIRTNVYFQEDHEGYIEFTIKVSDPNPAHFDKANVSVYLLTADQRVKVVIRGEPEEVNEFKDEFAEFLSNVTGVIVNVDQILTHQDSSGNPDPRKTDMYIHGIDPQTGEVLDADELIYLIDSNYEALADIFKTYNVIEVLPAVVDDGDKSVDRTVLFSLIAVAAVLICIILVVVGVFVVCRKKYKRKLKAATAVAYANSCASTMTRNGTIYGAGDGLNPMDTPNTNMHTFEGSNPIWMEKYDQGWPRESDDTDSKNSLDENDVIPTFAKGYDEHERTMEMHNDEFDQYNRVMTDNAGREGDAVLRAALNAHKQQNIDSSSQAGLISAPATPDRIRSGVTMGQSYHSNKALNNGNQGTLQNGVTLTPNSGHQSVRSNSSNNSKSHNGNHGNNMHSNHMNITSPQSSVIGYPNGSYETEATVI